MPISFTYVTNSSAEWGAGTGVQHTAAAVDGMFWDIQEFLNDLEDNPPSANSIANIYADGTQMHIVMDDASEFVVTMPQANFRPSVVATATADTSGSYLLDASDINKYLRYLGSTTLTVFIDDSDSIPVDSEFTMRQAGSGVIEFESTTDVTINPVSGYLNQTAGEGATVTLKKVASGSYDILGLLAAE